MGGFHGGHGRSSKGFHGGSHHSHRSSHSNFTSYKSCSTSGKTIEFDDDSGWVLVFASVFIGLFPLGFCILTFDLYFIVAGIIIFLLLVSLGIVLGRINDVERKAVEHTIFSLSDEEKQKMSEEEIETFNKDAEIKRRNFLITLAHPFKNKRNSRIFLIIGLGIIVVSFIVLILFMPRSVKASVTNVNELTIDYEYIFYGKNYTGSYTGLVYNLFEDSYKIPSIGENYKAYTTIINPNASTLSFNAWAYTSFVLIFLVGWGFILYSIIYRQSLLISIESIQDLNSDGKVDEEDLEIYFENTKDLDKPNKYCPKCGYKFKNGKTNCPNCNIIDNKGGDLS